MLTESEARDLLALAGATVEVSPVTTLPDVPPRRRWPVLAATAAVLAVVGVGAALGPGDLGSDPVAPSDTIPRVDFQVPENSVGPGQIPSVFAYDGSSAQAMLLALGLHVLIAPDPMCGSAGRATFTDPRVGAIYSPGDAVTLRVSTPPTGAVACSKPDSEDLAWQLIDFANGRGTAPAFADEVWVAANNDSDVIPAARAADPDSWVDGTPLGVLRQLSQEVSTSMGNAKKLVMPNLVTGASDSEWRCHDLDLSGIPRTGVGVSIRIELPPYECTVVDVFRTNGLISAISLRTDLVSVEPPIPGSVPDLIGLFEHEARAVLAQHDLTAEVLPPPGTKLCLRELPAIVGSQSPDAGTQLAPGSVVTVGMRWVSCDESPSGP